MTSCLGNNTGSLIPEYESWSHQDVFYVNNRGRCPNWVGNWLLDFPLQNQFKQKTKKKNIKKTKTEKKRKAELRSRTKKHDRTKY